MQTLKFLLTNSPIADKTPEWNDQFGAETVFWGVVRGIEDGKPITGINYTAYAAMAEKKLCEIGNEASSIFCAHRAKIIHRTGMVYAAEPSVVIRVGCARSSAAFEISQWYLDKLKRVVPIWKDVVYKGNHS